VTDVLWELLGKTLLPLLLWKGLKKCETVVELANVAKKP